MKYLEEEEVDIIVLNELKADSETLLESGVLDKYREIYPYIFYNCCKAPLKGYSGVAVMSKFKPISYSIDF
jgi:exonuclease III